MWFGTADGLNRFDGYSFTVYKHRSGDSTSLSSSAISSLVCDRNGILWIATGAGLDRYDRGAARFIREGGSGNDTSGLHRPGIATLVLGADMAMWIGTKGRGLLRLDTRSGAVKTFRHDPSNVQSLAGDSISCVYPASDGRIWVSYDGGGLSIFNERASVFSNFFTEVPDDSRGTDRDDSRGTDILVGLTRITSICEDRYRKLWFSSSGDGLFRFNDSLHQLVHYRHDAEDPDTYADNTATVLASDSRGDLWIGNSTKGIDRFDFAANAFRHAISEPHDRGSIGGDRVLSIIEDRNGSVWIGTSGGGISVYHPLRKKFAHIVSVRGDANSLGGNPVTSVCEDSSGGIWIGTERSGLDFFDPATGTFAHYRQQASNKKSLSSDAITSVRIDHLGMLWVGTARNGLNRFDPARRTAARYEYRTGDSTSLSSNSVTALFVDYTGAVWAGTADGVVHRYNRAKDAFDRMMLHDPTAVRAIDEDKVGNVWIGTADGIFRYTRATGAVKHYAIGEKGEHNPRVSQITSIAVDNDGVVWVGTDGAGAGKYDAGKDAFEQFDESAGLPDDWLKGLIADSRGGLWLATSKGIARYDPRTRTSRTYGIEEGVQGDEFSIGSYWKGHNGRFYFGGANGLNWFTPESLRENAAIPPVFITSMKLGDAGIPLEIMNGAIDDIHLPSAQGTVTLEFLTLDYTSPERNRIAYKLEGFDSSWIITGGHAVARYSNLGKGEYNFRVRGANNDGVWNEAGGTIRLIVHQQWWDHWWVRVSAVAGIAALPFAFYRFRIRRVAASERSRIRMVRELHDEVTATLSGIDYYSEVVRTGVKQNDEQRVEKYLTLIREGASAAQDSVADIIWTVNPELDGWDQLLTQFRRFASGVFERRSIRHAIEIPNDLSIPPFPLETRRKFWILYKEILLNLVQLSSSKMIAVRLVLGDDRRLNLVVAGDGDGIDAANQVSKDALARIRSRADDLHCALELDHPPEGGTTWKVFFPPG